MKALKMKLACGRWLYQVNNFNYCNYLKKKFKWRLYGGRRNVDGCERAELPNIGIHFFLLQILVIFLIKRIRYSEG